MKIFGVRCHVSGYNAHCLLLAVCCLLFAVYSSLFTFHFSLITHHSSLITYLLFTFHFSLFTARDLGYMTVDPDKKTIVVSPSIREEYENGRDYYALHGRPLAQPQNLMAIPSIENLTYHADHVFSLEA